VAGLYAGLYADVHSAPRTGRGRQASRIWVMDVWSAATATRNRTATRAPATARTRPSKRLEVSCR